MKTFSIVTGGSTGIGLEMAKHLAARSHNLILVSRDDDKLQKAADAIRRLHPGTVIHTLAIDLAKENGAELVFERTQQLSAEVDVLINNAGVGLYGEHLELDAGKLISMLQLNIVSVCELCLLFGQQMKTRGKGRILNIASPRRISPRRISLPTARPRRSCSISPRPWPKSSRTLAVTVGCLSPAPLTRPSSAKSIGAVRIPTISTSACAIRLRTLRPIGIDTMFSGRLSRIVGVCGTFGAHGSPALSHATFVANYAKALMRSSSSGSAAPRPQLTGR